MDQTPRVMIASVGGSPQPVIYSLNQICPDYVIYFTSRASRRMVRNEIEPALEFRPRDHDIITTPNEEDLECSVAELLRELSRLLELWDLSFHDLLGDYTGGTKTMSAALVLVLAEKGGRFSYVGGAGRTKDGLGVVIDGQEKALYLENPWDVLAIGACRDAELLFNRCRFLAVRDLAAENSRRTERHRPFFEALQHISEGYYSWDNFHYKQALDQLKRGASLLRGYASGSPQAGVKQFQQDVSKNLDLIENIQAEAGSLTKSNPGKKDLKPRELADRPPYLVLDLVANAVRRAEMEYKFDDAVARLYSAIEKMAKRQLKVVHDLDNSDLDLEAVPQSIRVELGECTNPREDGKIQVPLHKSFALLRALNDPLGESYQRREAELHKVLTIRNNSLLAHGFQPVRKETYQMLLGIALEFLDLRIEDLPRFPVLDFHGEGL
ncbi:MAG: TIGR02710 family CRISPR-associated CARF protein [Syntrophotalea sp.]|jgi:CRISPR-associated protein (TIGR02710 family)|uniref:TIGR02710 family CRISPR-associated CARF protein n=1 Tax=Syntrophotalea sp. TaxID=2812029 RepID=UPI003D1157BC